MFDWLKKTTKAQPIKARPGRAKGGAKAAGSAPAATMPEGHRQLMRLMREVRKKVSPEVLARARAAAESQVPQAPPEPVDNEASRLFKLAHANGGAKRDQVLAFLERKFKDKLN